VLLLGAGYFLARRALPEWSADPGATSRAGAVATVRGELTAAGGEPTRLVASVRNGSSAQRAYGRAFKILGPAAREWLIAAGDVPTWVVQGRLTVPGGGSGPFEAIVGRDLRLRRVEWSDSRSFGGMLQAGADEKSARDAFAVRLLERLRLSAGAEASGAVTTQEPFGSASVQVQALAVRPGAPREAIVAIQPGGGAFFWSRDLYSEEPEDYLSSRVLDKLLVAVIPTTLLVLATLVAFGVLLFKRRVSFRIALGLGGLTVASSLLAGTLFEPFAKDAPAWIAGISFVGRAVLLGLSVILWSVAESVIRDTVPGFTTSLDALVARRPGPRLGVALLAGLGAGAAAAGFSLLASSGAALLASPTFHPHFPSYAVPFFDGASNPFYAGTWYAGTFVFAAGLLRWVLPRAAADALAAFCFALYLATAQPIHPFWASALVSCLVAAAFGLVFRRHGLAALLAAALAQPLWIDLLASARIVSAAWLPFGVAAASLGAMAALAAFAYRRPEREDGVRVDAPEYVKRIESERRVTYEMGLLSRMQTALLPLAPPEETGFDLAARSILATEAGGDLYDFLVDRDGGLWIAAGDVSGHGYSCGIQQAMVKAAFHSLAKAGSPPGEVLGEVDRVLRTAGRESRLFTTLALLRIDPGTGKGLFANAGHPFPLLVREGRCEEIEAPGLPLGQGPARTYGDVEIELRPGEFLVLASDGLFEGPDRFDDPYGYERPKAVLESVGLWRRPPSAVVDALFADWRLHVGEGAPADDTTIVVVRRPVSSW
jgi:sigma-B regulation protein RsbU (phosphoserine phosphatase)